MTPEQAEHWWHTRNASGWTKGTQGGGAGRKITSWQSDMSASVSWVSESLAKATPKKKFAGHHEDIDVPDLYVNPNPATP